jgi:hypothetical protein
LNTTCCQQIELSGFVTNKLSAFSGFNSIPVL